MYLCHNSQMITWVHLQRNFIVRKFFLMGDSNINMLNCDSEQQILQILYMHHCHTPMFIFHLELHQSLKLLQIIYYIMISLKNMVGNIATFIFDNLSQYLIIRDHTTSQVLKITERKKSQKFENLIKKFFQDILHKSIGTITLKKDQNDTELSFELIL